MNLLSVERKEKSLLVEEVRESFMRQEGIDLILVKVRRAKKKGEVSLDGKIKVIAIGDH